MEDYDLNLNDRTYILVNLFIKKNLWNTWTNYEWGRERVATKRLMSKYPEFSFFYNLIELQDKFNSLLGLLNKDNTIKLHKKYNDFIVEFNKKSGYDIHGV